MFTILIIYPTLHRGTYSYAWYPQINLKKMYIICPRRCITFCFSVARIAVHLRKALVVLPSICMSDTTRYVAGWTNTTLESVRTSTVLCPYHNLPAVGLFSLLCRSSMTHTVFSLCSFFSPKHSKTYHFSRFLPACVGHIF